MFSSQTEFIFRDENTALCAMRAVLPEIGREHEKRSIVSIDTNKNVVLLKILAKDKRAMEASLNSYSRLLDVCKKISL